jgi:hypothetical protein
MPGVAGQDNPNPYSDFNRHFILKVNGRYYDPSYGKDYGNVLEWENDNVAGFFLEERYETSSKKQSIMWIVRKNGNQIDIKE